jgi:hypothetical protein
MSLACRSGAGSIRSTASRHRLNAPAGSRRPAGAPRARCAASAQVSLWHEAESLGSATTSSVIGGASVVLTARVGSAGHDPLQTNPALADGR